MKNQKKYTICFHDFYNMADKNTNSEAVAIRFYKRHKGYRCEIYMDGKQAYLVDNYQHQPYIVVA